MSPSSPASEIRSTQPLSKTPNVKLGRSTFRALRHRNYRLYFFGQMVSLFGSWMQTPALMQLAYEQTGQSFWPSIIGAVQILPTFFLGGWGGSLSDRVPRRNLIFVCQSGFLVQASLLAVLATGWFGAISPWSLLVLACFGGLINAFDLPARMSFLVDMVGMEDLVNAVALNSLLFNLARVVGPAVAIGVMIWLGPAACFAFNALSFLAVLAALALMDPIAQLRVAKESDNAPTGSGLRYLTERPELARVLMLAGVLCFFGWPTLALLPGLSDHRFDTGKVGVGFMLMPSASARCSPRW